MGLFDLARGVKLAGSRSYVLTGLGARLEQAVLRLTYDLLIERGFTPLVVPVLVGEPAMVGTGYFPTGRDQAYCVEKDRTGPSRYLGSQSEPVFTVVKSCRRMIFQRSIWPKAHVLGEKPAPTVKTRKDFNGFISFKKSNR